jgi:hypothetical protein
MESQNKIQVIFFVSLVIGLFLVFLFFLGNINNFGDNVYVLQTNGSFNCYQESYNTSNQTGLDGRCVLNYSGGYSNSTQWDNINNTNDGSIITYGNIHSGLYGTFNITYVKPRNITGAILSSYLWSTTPYGINNFNFSIPPECLNYSETYLIIGFNSSLLGSVYANFSCYTSNTTYIILNMSRVCAVGACAKLYEESIYWNVTDYTPVLSYTPTSRASTLLDKLLNILIIIIIICFSFYYVYKQGTGKNG